MARIAVVGSGVNGLLAAHGLLKQGHTVSLISERSAEDWLDKVPPTGTACRFATSLDLEAEIGLNHWDAQAPAIEGVNLTFCHKPGWQLIDLVGRLDRPARAVDVRLQSHRWTHDLEARGGTVEVAKVDVPRLDEIAAEKDLVLVAAWMRATFDRFYETSGKLTNAFNNLLLEEITPAAKEVLIAQYGSDGSPGNTSPSQRLANMFFNNFDDPTGFTDCLLDPEHAKRAVEETYGASAGSVGLKGRLRIAKGQIRQLIGLPRSSHPLARMKPAA